MIQTRLSSSGKRGFFSNHTSGIGSCKYFIIILLLTLWIFSTGFVSCATAADTIVDTNRVIHTPFDKESSGSTNFTVLTTVIGTIFDTNRPKYALVDQDNTNVTNLTVTPAGAHTISDSNISVYALVNKDSTDVTNLTVTPAGAHTISDSNISMYALVDEDSTDAIKLTAIAASENETYAYNLLDKGIKCFESGNIACSFESFEAAHNILPNDANILYIQAQAFSFQKRYDDALSKIDAGIALEPNSSMLWYQKGIILNNMGRFFESGSFFDRAEELEPGFEFPVTNRFPVNVILKNITFIVIVLGFCALGYLFYFKEIRR